MTESFARENRVAGLGLSLAFLLRLWKASGTFLNLDEAGCQGTELALPQPLCVGHSCLPPLTLIFNLLRHPRTSGTLAPTSKPRRVS